MIGAKINGMIAPIDTVPKTVIVEILTSPSAKGEPRLAEIVTTNPWQN